jgi:type II secretory pathway pseudopilin PulG
MERRHLLLVAMAVAAGLGAAGAAALVAGDDARVASAVTITLAQTTTQIAEPATTAATGTLVPPLAGRRLDAATAALKAARLRRQVDGGGVFGVIDDGAWVVCSTTPDAGAQVDPDTVVVVHVDRNCRG